MTPMNHRKAIPAKGIRLSASATSFAFVETHAPDACGSAGIARQSNPKLARVSNEKTTPAMAAAFGVLNPASVTPSTWFMRSTLPVGVRTGRIIRPLW